MATAHAQAAGKEARSAPSAAQGAGWRELLLRGIAPGLLGGAVMAAFLTIAAGVAGMPALAPLRTIGLTFAAPGALPGADGSALLGLVLHALVSAVLGIVFFAVFPRDLPPGCAAVVGAGYAAFALGIMAAVVVPTVNAPFREAMQPIGGSWVVAQVLFGVALGLGSELRRRLSRAGSGGAGPAAQSPETRRRVSQV
jgi:hypothetical protein